MAGVDIAYREHALGDGSVIMVIIKIGNDVADSDFGLLMRHLDMLDGEIIRINTEIKESNFRYADGLCDAGEYFIGHGFVAIQRYMTSTRTALGIAQEPAYSMPPFVNENLTFAQALNAGANYWKHVEEWIETLSKTENAKLQSQALNTIQTLEKTTEWEDYTCANLLANLVNGKDLALSNLLPGIAEWRGNLMSDR